MFRLIKQVFIGLLSFSGSVASWLMSLNVSMSLNNALCMTRPTFIGLNSDK